MAAQFGSESRRRRILILIGVLLAIMAGFAAFALTTRPAPTPVLEPRTSVLVAAADIPARTTIEAGQVVLREIPQSAVVTRVLTDPADAVGRLVTVTVLAGQQITPNLFGTSSDVDFTILDPQETVAPDSPYWRAASVTVPAERAVGGRLHAGQRIDLIANLSIQAGNFDPETNQFVPGVVDGRYVEGQTSKITYENVLLLATDPDAELYIVRVDLHQAEELALLQSRGDQFNIVLRPDQDTRTIDRLGFGETLDRIILEYRYIVPEIIDLFQLLPNPPIVPGGPTPGPIPTTPPDGSPPPGASPSPTP